MCNLNEELIKYVVVNIPKFGEFKVDVAYSTLPNACFAYKGRGHITRYYLNKPKAPPATKVPLAISRS